MTEPDEASKAPDAPQPDDRTRPDRRFRRVRAVLAPASRVVSKVPHPPLRSRRVSAFFAPVGRVLGKVPHPPLRSKRGLFVLFVLVAGFGAVATVGGVAVVGYTETSSFCGRCHTMAPELKAYAMSPHKQVACAACHVNPGVLGFIKAKANGTKQLLDIATGNFPTPIPPPDHADLPPVSETCLSCHSLNQITANGGPVQLVLRPTYKSDKTNTAETIAVMIRPAGLGQASSTPGTPGAPAVSADDAVRSVHWHVQEKVTYTASDVASQKIDLVNVTFSDGTTKQYIAGPQVSVSNNVQPDINRLRASETTRLMDCISCHNRIGHEIPSTDQAVDQALAAGQISTDLPFIKRDSVALLNAEYPSLAAANTAIDGLRSTYASQYPLVVKTQAAQVTQAIDELKVEYSLIATPQMKVYAQTYPDNLGHQTSLGCFRCHDGAHYLVVKGQVTNQTIPSACATCHTFPQISTSTAAVSFPLGTQPADHKDKLYVFDHKNATSSVEPAGTNCAACHAASYCQSCHDSGAIKVNHTAMLTNHANAAVAAGGTQACAYCHLPVFCSKCHKGPVLKPNALPPTIESGKAL
jgi:nitrate/TMAO reductase-like tetraheme cytochrome c subunit